MMTYLGFERGQRRAAEAVYNARLAYLGYSDRDYLTYGTAVQDSSLLKYID